MYGLDLNVHGTSLSRPRQKVRDRACRVLARMRTNKRACGCGAVCESDVMLLLGDLLFEGRIDHGLEHVKAVYGPTGSLHSCITSGILREHLEIIAPWLTLVKSLDALALIQALAHFGKRFHLDLLVRNRYTIWVNETLPTCSTICARRV